MCFAERLCSVRLFYLSFFILYPSFFIPGIVNSSAQLVRVRAHQFFVWLVRVRAIFCAARFRAHPNTYILARTRTSYFFASHISLARLRAHLERRPLALVRVRAQFQRYFFARTRASALLRPPPVARTRASYKKSIISLHVRVRAAAS